MKERQGRLMLIIKNCNLLNMADIYEEKKDISVENGKIVEISNEIDISKHKDCKIIDAKGNFVTPGIVEPHCQLGIKEEIHRFDGDDSNEETDPILPQLRAIDAINPTDEGFDMAKRAGVTTVITGPGESNLIGGTFAAVKTYGKTVNDMVIKDEIAFKFSLGNTVKNIYGKKGNMPKTRMASAAMIRDILIKAKEYHRLYQLSINDKTGKVNPPKFDIKLHSLMRVFDGMLVKFTTHQAYDILTAIRIGEEFKLNYTVDKCSEAYLIPKELKGYSTKCVIGPAYGGKRDPEVRNRDTIIAGIMEKNDLNFAISSGHPEVNIELTMVQTIMMYKKGLSRKMALKAMTINAAKILGLEDRIGSIEIGKDADIIIWNGEPLDYYSYPETVLIDGNVVYNKEVI
ncbi:amidohydrolase [Clostridium tetani]|nr:amidohydrolase [Clostridium tetani]RYU98689.1 amidohydrolase [Clostridium tetani]